MHARPISPPAAPADAGLSALGLLMRVGGILGTWTAAVCCVAAMTSRRTHLVIVAFFAVGLLRAVLHGQAGRALQQCRPSAGTLARLYVIVAIGHTATLFFISTPASSGVRPLIQATLLLTSGWPIVVAGLLLRPSARAVRASVTDTGRRVFAEDGAATGASVLMFLLGILGAAMWAIVLIASVPDRVRITYLLVVLILLTLIIRAVVQARMGFRNMNQFKPLQFRTDVQRYLKLAVMTTIALTMFLAMSMLARRPRLANFMLLIPMAGVLLAWPWALRTVGAPEPAPDDRSPPELGAARDNGVVMLGIVLLALSAIAATALLTRHFEIEVHRQLRHLHALATNSGAWTAWVTLAIGVWAGIECVAMSARRKIAVIAYLLASVVGLILSYTALMDVPAFRSATSLGLMLAINSAFALALPGVLSWQVWRSPPPPAHDPEAAF